MLPCFINDGEVGLKEPFLQDEVLIQMRLHCLKPVLSPEKLYLVFSHQPQLRECCINTTHSTRCLESQRIQLRLCRGRPGSAVQHSVSCADCAVQTPAHFTALQLVNCSPSPFHRRFYPRFEQAVDGAAMLVSIQYTQSTFTALIGA